MNTHNEYLYFKSNIRTLNDTHTHMIYECYKSSTQSP